MPADCSECSGCTLPGHEFSEPCQRTPAPSPGWSPRPSSANRPGPTGTDSSVATAQDIAYTLGYATPRGLLSRSHRRRRRDPGTPLQTALTAGFLRRRPALGHSFAATIPRNVVYPPRGIEGLKSATREEFQSRTRVLHQDADCTVTLGGLRVMARNRLIAPINVRSTDKAGVTRQFAHPYRNVGITSCSRLE
jgi:hypothetical protein